MTEPVAMPASPRRTVRVAVALVAGQAALCAVIGWLTFGPSPAPSQPSAALDPPPILPPPATTPSVRLDPPRTAPPTTRARSSRAAAVARFSRPPRPPAPPRRTAREVATEDPPATMNSPSTSPPEEPVPPDPDPNATPLPSETREVQAPVVEGEPCEPEGAPGLTVDDVALQCVRAEDGRLVWQINSQR